MRYWGFSDAVASPGGSDGGVDVQSSRALGQVKYQAAHVGRPELQRLVGARGRQHDLILIMFTGAGYSPAALQYANEMDIALFFFELDGSMVPANHAAGQIYSGRTHPNVGPTSSRGRKWRVGFAILFFFAPFTNLQNEEAYNGPPLHDLLNFMVHLSVCWAIALVLVKWGTRPSRPESG
jgi:hypothetical protein